MTVSKKRREHERFAAKVNSLNSVYNPPNPPAILYHYTDFAGLRGILASDRLWATYNRVLNDFTEQDHALRVLSAALNRFGKYTGAVAVDLLNKLPQKLRFVACFCESDDLLSMWRSYAGDGGGYCLGFDYEGLRDTGFLNMRVGSSFPLLARVSYGDVPRDILTYLKASVAYTKATTNTLDALVETISPFFPSMIKDKAFSEEREWRKIALDPPVEWIQFRSGHANIKPYVELACVHAFSNFKLPLVSLTYGPTLRREDHPEEILGWMLEKYGYPKVRVKPAGIPYRR